jgi:hypothetical protein
MPFQPATDFLFCVRFAADLSLGEARDVKKLPYYIAKTVQAAGLLLVLNTWFVSLVADGSMNFLFKFTVTGMAIFMVGWMFQRFF